MVYLSVNFAMMKFPPAPRVLSECYTRCCLLDSQRDQSHQVSLAESGVKDVRPFLPALILHRHTFEPIC